jgi:maleate isomerase
MTQEILRFLPNVTAHFSRFPVLSISLKENALKQFETDELLRAAKLLADARVDAIIWSGTSSGWLGIGADQELCEVIKTATGIYTTTSVLALFDAFEAVNAKRIGLCTPYLDDVQTRIIETFRRNGYETVAESHLGLEENFSFCTVQEPAIDEMVTAVATEKPEAITIFCTNLRGVAVVKRMEAKIGIPVFDTVATPIWAVLQRAGIDTSEISDHGKLFSLKLK